MKGSTTSPTRRLSDMGIILPKPRTPVANFLPFKRCGNLLYLSGQGPVSEDGHRHIGKVGQEVSVAEAYEHAKLTTINLLAVTEMALGSINAVAEVIKVLGFVNAAPDFTSHPQVINGCSDLLIAVFGNEKGAHARSAVGAGSLPSGITVEIEIILRAH